jgi:CheY-like chemotaxis protein
MTIPTLQSVLCVDDDPDICAVLEAALSLVSGLSVHIADSGERAIDLAYELRPDLILMDVMMPGLDGPCTVRRMRERSLIGRIPVIFLTGKVMRTEVANFLDLGAIGVIGKPFDPLTLGTELASIWRHPHAGAFPRLAGEFAAGPNRPVDELTLRFRERLRRDVVVLRDLAVVAQQGEVRVLPDIERLSVRWAASSNSCAEKSSPAYRRPLRAPCSSCCSSCAHAATSCSNPPRRRWAMPATRRACATSVRGLPFRTVTAPPAAAPARHSAAGPRETSCHGRDPSRSRWSRPSPR